MTIIESLAAYGAQLSTTPLSPEVLHHAKRAVIDWYAALLPGAVCEPPTLLEQALADDLDHGRARLALGRAASTRTAALINGTAAHTVEFDDIYREAIYHPGAPTIAAAWAVAQETNASGLDLLRAVVAGYEISTRIGATLGRAHYKHWHNTGTVGSFGAAAAAATLYRLPPSAYAHALATVGTFAAGLQQAFRMDSMSKPLHAGRAAEAGVLAAQAARAGVTGSLDILEGEAGMGVAMGNGPNWQPMLGDLGRVFNIQHMTFKNHACCGHTFAAIDGALALQQRMGVRAEDLAAVHIETYQPALDVAGNPNPATAAEARFSLPFVVASALVHGSVRLAAFTPERLADTQVRGLMQRLSLRADAQIDAGFPGQRAARVRLVARDGRDDVFFQPNRKGDPEDPLTDADLDGKFIELAAPVIGDAAARAMLQQLWQLELAAQLP